MLSTFCFIGTSIDWLVIFFVVTMQWKYVVLNLSNIWSTSQWTPTNQFSSGENVFHCRFFGKNDMRNTCSTLWVLIYMIFCQSFDCYLSLNVWTENTIFLFESVSLLMTQWAWTSIEIPFENLNSRRKNMKSVWLLNEWIVYGTSIFDYYETDCNDFDACIVQCK